MDNSAGEKGWADGRMRKVYDPMWWYSKDDKVRYHSGYKEGHDASRSCTR